MDRVRRVISVPLVVLMFTGVLAVAAATQASPAGAVEGGSSPSTAAQICDSDTLDGSHAGGGNAPSRFGTAWIPAGGSVKFTASGAITPSTYWGSGRGEYKFYVRIAHPGMATWTEWNYKATGIISGPPYPQQPFSGLVIDTFYNTTGSAATFTIETWAERTYAGAGVTWSLDLDTSAGPRPPCELIADEVDVPNASEPGACGAQPGAADPVNVVQGNFWDSWTDVAIAGRGPGVALERAYSSSRAAVNSPFGYGWNWNYGMSVSEASGIATVRQENGAVVRFASANGGWVTGPRVNATLVKEVDNSWTFTRNGVEVFKFSSAGVLTSIRDLSGNITTLAYSSGQLSTVTDTAGRALTFTWASGRITGVAAPNTVLATGASAVPVAVSYTYDGAGNLQTVTDTTGGIWTYGYDGSHRMTTIREPRHHSLGGAAPVVENNYDAGTGKVLWQDDRLDRRTTFTYAANATTVTSPAGTALSPTTEVTRYEHNDGICTAIVRDPNGTPSRWDFEVDEATLGRTKVTDPNGKITTAAFNERGLPTTVNEAGRTTTITYTAQGLPATVTDPMNVTTTYTYDTGTDRLRTVSRPITPGSGTAVTTLNYTDVANPGRVTSVVDTRGKTWTMTYTAAGDLASSTDPTGKQTTWSYNSLGWPLSTVAPAGNVGGGTPAQHRTSYTYNKRAQVMTVTDPLTFVTEYDRDLSGNVIAQRDPVTSGTEQTGFTINAAGELTTVTRPGGSTLVTEYTRGGQIFKQLDGASSPTEYGYDVQGRLSTVKDPANRVTTFRYDAGGRVASKQQPGGNCLAVPKTGCISYGYNTTDELTGVDYSDAATADVTFSYDNLGRRTGMNDGAASTWNWDSLGRLLSFVDANGTVSYTFTDNGAGPTTITYPGGKAVSRTYDDAGRQITSTGWTGGTATYGYDDNSNPTTINTGATAGVEDTFGYDRANRMTAATLRQNTTVLTALGYTRDPEGMVTQTTSTGISGAADTFTYGPFDQLATNSTGAYTYDAADNLTGFPDGRKQKFNAANELCYQAASNSAACGSAPAGATRYEYDGRGNRTAIRPDNRVATTLAYDQADRLKSAKVPAYPDGTGQYHDMSTANVWFAAAASWSTNQVGTYQITGANGIPATGVESVVLRLHVAAPTNFGALVAYPAGTSPGSTVSMYYDPGDATSNLAVSKLNGSGQVSVYTSAATLISIELVGWYGSANADGGVTFEPVPSARPYFASQTAGSTSAPIQITGNYGVPASGVSAVAVVAHSVGASTPGHLTVFSGSTAPNTVTLLYDSAAASALTIVPVDSSGQIKVYTTQATAPAIDVVGYYTPVESGGGNVAHTVTPSALADTYNHTGVCNGGTCNRLVANTTQTMKVTGVGGIPTNAAAVAVVLQAFVPDATGYLTAWRTGDAQPGTAAMTFDGDAFISSTAIVPVGTGGTISVQSSVGVDLIVQAIGYFDPATKTYQYSYAGDGLRKQKTAPDGTTSKFVWDRSNSIPVLLAETIDETGTANDRTVRYIYGPDGTVTSDVTTMTTSGTETLRWFHHDQLGSTVAITNTTGGLLGTFAYTPVGAAGTVTGSATTPIGWAGEYRDTETGFTYLRARYYDPATANFLTRDPLESVTRAAYSYGLNNPVNVTDPTGLFSIGGFLGGIGDLLTGGDCGDGLLGAAGSVLGGIGETARSAVDDLTTLVGNNWRTWTAIAGIGTCILVTVGSACIAVLGAGFLARSAGTVATHGFSSGTLQTIGVDAIWTAASIAVAGTTSGAVGPQSAGPVLIPAMSATGTRLVQAIPAGFDAAMVQWGPTWIPR